MAGPPVLSLFFFNDTATTEIYTLSLHDALPISVLTALQDVENDLSTLRILQQQHQVLLLQRSEEHTSELQSHSDIVCRLLLEKKKAATSSVVPLMASVYLDALSPCDRIAGKPHT